MDSNDETKTDISCPCCGSIKVIEISVIVTSSVEKEMLGAEPKEVEYPIYRCQVCGREFEGREI